MSTFNDPSNWVLGTFYYNKDDKRILVPKQFSWTGWTINFASPYAFIVLAILILPIVLLIL